jgi:hypothetical protein
MAELAGIVIGAVGLIALESTVRRPNSPHALTSDLCPQVEDFFEKVTTWREYGKDHEHYRTKLDMARVAYQRWRKSVNIVDTIVDVRANLPIADHHEADTVKRLLGQIAAAFQEAEKTSEQFESKEPDTKASRGVGANDLQAAYQAAIEMRQKGTGTWKKFRWVVHDKKVLATLTGRVSTIMHNSAHVDTEYSHRLRSMSRA